MVSAKTSYTISKVIIVQIFRGSRSDPQKTLTRFKSGKDKYSTLTIVTINPQIRLDLSPSRIYQTIRLVWFDPDDFHFILFSANFLNSLYVLHRKSYIIWSIYCLFGSFRAFFLLLFPHWLFLAVRDVLVYDLWIYFFFFVCLS